MANGGDGSVGAFVEELTQAAARRGPDRVGLGDQESLESLLQRAPAGSVNAKNKMGYTAIQVVNRESPGRVRLLLDHGADPNVADITGRTILHDVAHSGDLDVFDLLLAGGTRSIADLRGNTPAHEIAISGHHNSICMLQRLSGECSLQERNIDGQTPLDKARDKGHQVLVDWFESHVADQE